MEKKISVVMTTHNKAKYLDLTLAGYQQQSYKDFEIVIIDDGSTDNTKEIIDSYKNDLNICYAKYEKIGISKVRKATLELAKGDYIIITDDDRIPCKDFVYSHKKKLDSGEKCVNVGKECLILSFFMRDVKYKFIDEFKIYTLYPELLELTEKQMFTAQDIRDNYDEVINKYFLSDYTESRLVDMVDRYGEELNGFYLGWSRAFGGNMAFDRTLCNKALEYDENYKGYGIEDIDFSYQLFLQGFVFHFDSDAKNYHQEHPRSKVENSDMYKNFQYFCSKYPTLEVQLMKMEWDNMISLELANDFYRVLKEQKELLKDNILKVLMA
ncbi:MAG: glycosyltransferase [Eubacterium sp.]|nr:glycosyltransferase [Eubacterium sp.]